MPTITLEELRRILLLKYEGCDDSEVISIGRWPSEARFSADIQITVGMLRRNDYGGDEEKKSGWRCDVCGYTHPDCENVITHIEEKHNYARDDAELCTCVNE